MAKQHKGRRNATTWIVALIALVAVRVADGRFTPRKGQPKGRKSTSAPIASPTKALKEALPKASVSKVPVIAKGNLTKLVPKGLKSSLIMHGGANSISHKKTIAVAPKAKGRKGGKYLGLMNDSLKPLALMVSKGNVTEKVRPLTKGSSTKTVRPVAKGNAKKLAPIASKGNVTKKIRAVTKGNASKTVRPLVKGNSTKKDPSASASVTKGPKRLL